MRLADTTAPVTETEAETTVDSLPGDLVSGISTSILAGDSAYEICAGYSMCLASLTSAQLLCDLASTDYLDFTQHWWSDELLTETSVDGKWTLDKMIELTEGVYADLNGNNEKDRDDQCDTIVYPVFIDGFYFSAGMNTTQINKDGIPVVSDDYAGEKDPDRASAVLEALASESYRIVTPALFETAMKVKYSEDERDAQMYDILKSTVVLYFDRVFNDSLGSKTYSMFRSSIMNNNTNWASTWEGNKDSLNSMLADVVAAFEK